MDATDAVPTQAYQKQKAMTTCERTPEEDATSPLHMTQPHNYMQGIVGLTAGEVGLTAGSPPLLEVLFATHADVDPLFGLQCCAVWKSTSASGARSSGEEPASPRQRAGVASMAWRTTR